MSFPLMFTAFRVALDTSDQRLFDIARTLGATPRYTMLRVQIRSALPYHLLERPAVLILGAGGGADVLLALYHNAAPIDAVELNAQVVRLVRATYADFAGTTFWFCSAGCQAAFEKEPQRYLRPIEA